MEITTNVDAINSQIAYCHYFLYGFIFHPC